MLSAFVTMRSAAGAEVTFYAEDEGTLAVMVSGQKAAYEKIEPAIKQFGKLFYVGEGAGLVALTGSDRQAGGRHLGPERCEPRQLDSVAGCVYE